MNEPTQTYNPQLPPPRRKTNWVPWVIIGFVVLLLGGCFMTMVTAVAEAGSSVSFSSGSSSDDYTTGVFHEDEGASEKLAVVAIRGVISGQRSSYKESMTDEAIKQIEQATEDKDIKGLLLYLDTPGGEVTASDKIYHACKQFSETGRPIVAYMDTVAASGGYYIACAADEVVATETTITGSIGVIIGGLNGKELFDKLGLKDQTFKSGAFKDTLSMSRDMREDERAYIQSLVDETYEKFAGIVSEARNIPVETLKDGIADGRIFHGVKAKEVGLIDHTGYVEDAIEVLKKRANLEKAKVIHYKQEPSFGDVLSILGVKAQSESEVKVDWGQGKFTQNLKPFVPYIILPGY